MLRGKFKFGMPILELEIENNFIEVLLDTGFNGQLMLPISLIKKLKLEKIADGDYITADGGRKDTEVYKARVKILNKEKEAEVLATNSNFSLAGMELFHDFRIVIERDKNILDIDESEEN